MPSSAGDTQSNQTSICNDTLYFFQSFQATHDCIVMAHGGVESNTPPFAAPTDISFFVDHRQPLVNPSPLEKISSHANPATAQHITAGNNCENYWLAKVTGKHLPINRFSYKDIYEWMESAQNPNPHAAANAVVRTWFPHVVTVRNRIDSHRIRLQDALTGILAHNGAINHFYVLSCRSIMYTLLEKAALRALGLR